MEIAAFINRLPEVLGHHGIDPEDEAPELFALVEAFETIARDVVTDQTSADLEDTVTVEYSNDTKSEPATLGMDRRVGVYDESGPRGALTLFFDLELKPEPGFALPASASFYGRGGRPVRR